MKLIALCIFFLFAGMLVAGQSYSDSMNAYQANYVTQHQVVQGKDKGFMQFFPPDSSFRVMATVSYVDQSPWEAFATSSGARKNYRVYAVLKFMLHQESFSLNLYQSQDLMGQAQYRDYLFLPFTDSTNGNESYASGRYLELREGEIINNTALIDFNKAYNPYCAYVKYYSCPIPPAGNHLKYTIRAGEKNFAKTQ